MDWILKLDHNLFFVINNFRNSIFDSFFYAISLVGEYGLIWIIVGITALIVDKKNGKRFFVLLAIALLLTVFIDDVLIKLFFFRERPYLALENVYQYGEMWKSSSFPSGHATATFAAITIIYYCYKRYFKWALIFGFLTLYARPYLGMHYPTDVIAGAIIGILSGILVIYFYKKIYRPKQSLTGKIFDFYHHLSWKPKLLAYISIIVLLLIYYSIRGGLLGALFVLILSILGFIIYLAFDRIWYFLRRKKVNPWISNSILILGIILFLLVIVYGLIIGARLAFDNEKLTDNDKHLVIMVVDGASLVNAKQLFMDGLTEDKNYTQEISKGFPNISKYFIQDGTYTANGISVWPSSSIPAHTGIITGNYPRETGIMGQRQFEREARRYTSYIGLGIQMHRNILDKSVKTLCERFSQVRSLDVLQIANRGCSLFIPETPHDEKVLTRSEQIIDTTSALSKFSGKNEIPKIVVMTLPDIDHTTHNNKVSSEESKKLYIHADEEVGRIIDLYKEKGLYDKTLFVLAADHGMGEVNNHVTLDNIINDMRFNSFQSLKWKVIPAWGSFEANFYVGTKYKFNKEYNAVALWGGNSDALIYFKGQRKDSAGNVIFESWDIKPTDDDLKSYSVGGDKIDVIARLFEYSPGIGLVFTNPESNIFNVYSSEGQSQIVERQNNGKLEFSYKIVSGKDPLGYVEIEAMKNYIKNSDFLSDEQWINLSYLTHYPDAIRRIAYSFGNDNSATLNIVAKDSWDFTPWYVASKVLVGSHGSLNAQQSLVPIMFHGPGVKQSEMPFARTVDILPTILAYFGQPTDGVQGKVLPIFDDEKTNQPLEDKNSYQTGPKFSCGKVDYFLKSTYGSYDKKLAKIENGIEEIVIPSLKKQFPNLDTKINLTANIKDIQCGNSIRFQEEYVAEEKIGETFEFSLPL